MSQIAIGIPAGYSSSQTDVHFVYFQYTISEVFLSSTTAISFSLKGRNLIIYEKKLIHSAALSSRATGQVDKRLDLVGFGGKIYLNATKTMSPN